MATVELKRNFTNLLPIVALSANGMEGDKEYYMAKGLDEYLAKPVRIEDLRRTLSLVKEGKILSNVLV